jgi:hypothetical protein
MLRICGYLVSNKPEILNLLMLLSSNLLLQSSREPLLLSPMKRTSSAGSPHCQLNAILKVLTVHAYIEIRGIR